MAALNAANKRKLEMPLDLKYLVVDGHLVVFSIGIYLAGLHAINGTFNIDIFQRSRSTSSPLEKKRSKSTKKRSSLAGFSSGLTRFDRVCSLGSFRVHPEPVREGRVHSKYRKGGALIVRWGLTFEYI